MAEPDVAPTPPASEVAAGAASGRAANTEGAAPGARASCPGRALPRFSLALVCGLHALGLGAAAWVLPWRGGSPAGLALFALALLHAFAALCALLRRARALRVTWQLVAWASLLALALATFAIASSALYLAELYQGIGRALAGALAGVWGLIVLFTLPVAWWGLAQTGARLRRRGARWLLALALGAAGVAAERARAAAGPRWLAPVSEPAAAQRFGEVVRARSRVGEPGSAASLFQRAPLACAAPITAERLTLFVGYLGRDGEPRGACLQERELGGLASALDQLLRERALPGAALKLDLVRALHPLSALHPLLDALALRPALDGACLGQHCLLPWQLVALDVFTRHRPLPAVRDMSFGFSTEAVAALLGKPSAARSELARIETFSYAAGHGRLTPLRRLRRARERVGAGVGATALASAVARAEDHIVSAQLGDGSFRYLLNPYTAEQPSGNMSLPRQAGTTLVLCELGAKPSHRAAVARALRWLAGHERQRGALSLLSRADDAELGPSALALAAFVRCRELAGGEHDALIARLGDFILHMQRPDGSFFPEFDLALGEAHGRHESLYGSGQALLALVWLERLARSGAAPAADLPARERLSAAIDRAMAFYAGHWPRALRDFFFLEENWHCLAARAALPSHRRDDYERFCLDYVAFKSRFILSAGGTAPEFVGGYGLGNLFPPHNTPTAGFGEALAAALAIERARGLDRRPHQQLMREVLGFLLRAQWDEASCFACGASGALGGYSEHVASPLIRIDYVQHAMAALGHGAAALGADALGADGTEAAPRGRPTN